MNDLTVRAASLADTPALADLAARTFPLANPPGADLVNIAEFIADNLTAAHFEQHLANVNARLFAATLPHISDDSSTSSDSHSSEGLIEDGARTRERLVGYSLVFVGEDGVAQPSFGVRNSPSAYLSKFYVDPQAHGSGVARTMMLHVLQNAKELGASSVWLAVNHENAKAQRFYEKNGFERVGVKTMVVGNKVHDDFVYEYTL